VGIPVAREQQTPSAVFFQIVTPIGGGHVSAAFESASRPSFLSHFGSY
jgi:hypothetical protein